jgi:hypothetical protein
MTISFLSKGVYGSNADELTYIICSIVIFQPTIQGITGNSFLDFPYLIFDYRLYEEACPASQRYF